MNKNIIYNDKIYNNFYNYILKNNYPFRFYDDSVLDDDIFFSELQVNIIKILEKYNYKLFFFNCSPKTNLIIKFRNSKYTILNNTIITPKAEFWNLSDKTVDLDFEDVIKIKKLLSEDMYYLYENQLFEVICKLPKINTQNNYYFDILLVVNHNFNLNSVLDHNFNLINIDSVNTVNINDVTHNWIKNKFIKNTVFNNWSLINEKISYNYKNSELKFDDFLKNYNINFPENVKEEYKNINSLFFIKNFNQNEYVKFCFKLLDAQIWSFDRKFIKLKNDFGFNYTYIEDYNFNSIFLTSSWISDEDYGFNCIYDWCDSYFLFISGINKFYLNGNEFNEFNVLEFTEEEYNYHEFYE